MNVPFEEQNKEEANEVKLPYELRHSEPKEHFEDQRENEEGNDCNRSGNHEKVGAARHQTQRIAAFSVREHARDRQIRTLITDKGIVD